jgi:hypothetical protein
VKKVSGRLPLHRIRHRHRALHRILVIPEAVGRVVVEVAVLVVDQVVVGAAEEEVVVGGVVEAAAVAAEVEAAA